MIVGPIDTFSNASLDRRAKVTLHETITAKPKKKKVPVKLAPGSYASPKTPDMAPPRTTPYGGPMTPTPHQYVRPGGNDFLKYQSKGYPC